MTVTDVDLNWQGFDAARGLHPRAKAPAPQSAASTSLVPLSPAAQAQIKLIQKEAGLPQTGQLSPALIQYVNKTYQTQISGKGGGAKKKAKKKAAKKTTPKKKATSTTAKSKAYQKKLAAKRKAAQLLAQQKAEYKWEQAQAKRTHVSARARKDTVVTGKTPKR